MNAQVEQLYGTWRLVSRTQEMVGTGERTEPFGKAPHGFIAYGRDGRMSVIIVSENRPKPMDPANPTDQERVELMKSAIAYAGTFTIEGSRVMHHVDINLGGNVTGTPLVRHFRIDGRTLTIRTDPTVRSIDGKQTFGVLTWEKVQ